jgi:hypothetical protein
MMGLAASITPAGSGNIIIVIAGDTDNDTAADGTKMGIRYGTGSAPSNGAALTGTAVGSLVNSSNASLALDVERFPFAVSAVVTGLTLGTAYWVDLSLAAVTGGTARVRDISVSIAEIGAGAQGVQGTQGTQGTQGSQGTQGNQGSQGTQGTQGNQGVQSSWAVQGSQHAISTVFADVTGLSVSSLATSATYEYLAEMGVQSSSTAGVQYCIQCSVAGATLEGQIRGFQTAIIYRSERQTTQGAQGSAFTLINGNGVITLTGILITPGSGSPSIGVQAKKVTSGTGAVYANSFLRVTRIA